MSKLLNNFVGIDISKTYFDVVIVKYPLAEEATHHQFSQGPEGYSRMLQWLQQHDVLIDETTLFCMEYTGLYNTGLINFLVASKALLWVEMPLRIKKAGGFERGSNDKTAAAKIALYALRYQDQMQLWQPVDSNLQKIKDLVAQRDRIVSAINQLKVPVDELKECGCMAQAKLMEKLQEPALKALQKSKLSIEGQISKTVQSDETISNKVAHLQSIKGIGPVTAVALFIYTKGFTSFRNAKELACYCGVVPFKKQSGTSVRFKPSVSPFANKKLKRLLHLCALSAIKNDHELKLYFQRKLAEGKNKMSVINAVRNKLIHRVFAIIRDNRFFELNYVPKCA
jgi:transposase